MVGLVPFEGKVTIFMGVWTIENVKRRNSRKEHDISYSPYLLSDLSLTFLLKNYTWLAIGFLGSRVTCSYPFHLRRKPHYCAPFVASTYLLVKG